MTVLLGRGEICLLCLVTKNRTRNNTATAITTITAITTTMATMAGGMVDDSSLVVFSLDGLAVCMGSGEVSDVNWDIGDTVDPVRGEGGEVRASVWANVGMIGEEEDGRRVVVGCGILVSTVKAVVIKIVQSLCIIPILNIYLPIGVISGIDPDNMLAPRAVLKINATCSIFRLYPSNVFALLVSCTIDAGVVSLPSLVKNPTTVPAVTIIGVRRVH